MTLLGETRHKRAAITISLLVLLAGLSAGALWLERDGTALPGLSVWGERVGGMSRKRLKSHLRERVAAWEKEVVEVQAAGKTWSVTRADLGLSVDRNAMVEQAMAVGHAGSLWQKILDRIWARKGRFHFLPLVTADRDRLLAKVSEFKEAVDRTARRPRFDFRKKAVEPGRQGLLLDKYQSAAAILEAAMTGKRTIDLVVRTTNARAAGKTQVDISTVLGWYETPFKSRGKWAHRAHNLKVAARKLNGHVIWPGQVFSFNETVGPRTAKEGYRVAPVISRGEMVDGMAGGACQISSTLYAAAFFAGLEFVEADVHSQPSHYIELGLDATVVWPDKDLKLKNPYPFPVVLHYEVAFGRVRTEILGPKRPYHKIAFERRIVGSKPYREVYRPEPTMLVGTREIQQRGEFGYKVRRRRVFFDKQGMEVKAQYWTVIYPPTTLIVKVGTKPRPEPVEPAQPGQTTEPTEPQEEPKPIPPKPMPKRFVRIVQ